MFGYATSMDTYGYVIGFETFRYLYNFPRANSTKINPIFCYFFYGLLKTNPTLELEKNSSYLPNFRPPFLVKWDQPHFCRAIFMAIFSINTFLIVLFSIFLSPTVGTYKKLINLLFKHYRIIHSYVRFWAAATEGSTMIWDPKNMAPVNK